jgi:hypothetical protein
MHAASPCTRIRLGRAESSRSRAWSGRSVPENELQVGRSEHSRAALAHLGRREPARLDGERWLHGRRESGEDAGNGARPAGTRWASAREDTVGAGRVDEGNHEWRRG